MAQVQNLFSLLDGEEDASKIIQAAMAAAKTAATQEKKPPHKAESKKEVTVFNPEMMKAKRLVLPYHLLRSQIVFRKEKPEEKQVEGEGSVGNPGEQKEDGHSSTSSQYSVANESANSNGYRGADRYKGEKNGYSNNYDHSNNGRNNGVTACCQGNSRSVDQYRDNRDNNKKLPGNINRGINGPKMGNGGHSSQYVDNDGWQISIRRHGHSKGFNGLANKGEIATSSQSQDGDNQQQVNEVHNEERVSGNNFYGGDGRQKYSGGYPINRRKDGRFSNKYNGNNNRSNNGKIGESNGREERSNVCVKELEKAVPNTADGETNSNGAETNYGNGSSGVEGHKDSKDLEKSRKNGHETQDKPDDDENKMTLKEYEKMQLEKRKALDSLKKTEQRRVILAKDFESMQLVERKNEDDFAVKLNSGKDSSKRKDSFKEEKIRKSMSIDEFLKPENGEGRRVHWRERSLDGHPGRRPFQGRGFNGHDGSNSDRFLGRPLHGGEKCNGVNGFVKKHNKGVERKMQNGHGERPIAGHGNGTTAAAIPIAEDPNQFPALGGAVKQ